MSDSETSKYTPEKWNDIRKQMMSSGMAEIELSSLAENVGISLKGSAGPLTPADLIIFSYEELQMHPDFGSTKAIDQLIDILDETLAFDSPFGDMVVNELSSGEENEIIKRSIRLGIEQNYPIRYTNLSKMTQEFCQSEDIKTLGQLMEFSSNMAQNVVVGGDFRSLLNAISSEDEKLLAKFIPFRPGEKGLKLPEAIAILAERYSKKEITALNHKYGYKLPKEEIRAIKTISPKKLEKLETEMQSDLVSILDLFPDDQRKLIASNISTQEELNNYFSSIPNAKIRNVAVCVLYKYINGSFPKRKGFFARLLSVFGG